jgi:hypothetical protein
MKAKVKSYGIWNEVITNPNSSGVVVNKNIEKAVKRVINLIDNANALYISNIVSIYPEEKKLTPIFIKNTNAAKNNELERDFIHSFNILAVYAIGSCIINNKIETCISIYIIEIKKIENEIANFTRGSSSCIGD